MLVDINPNYEVIEGPYKVGMPELIEKGLKSFTIMDYIENFVDAIKNNKQAKIKFFLEDPNRTYWDSIDEIPYHDGTFTVVPNSPNLLNIRENTKLVNYSLPSTKGDYKKLTEQHGLIARAKPGLILDQPLTADQFRVHEVWHKLLQGRQDLQNEVAEFLFKYYKQKLDLNKLMGVYLPSDDKEPRSSAWYLRNLDYRPVVGARGGLGRNARFFGARAQNLETKVE